ncbi:MAG: hypothetical protein WKG07_15610 [Hymenobacter sp.]
MVATASAGAAAAGAGVVAIEVRRGVGSFWLSSWRSSSSYRWSRGDHSRGSGHRGGNLGASRGRARGYGHRLGAQIRSRAR